MTESAVTRRYRLVAHPTQPEAAASAAIEVLWREERGPEDHGFFRIIYKIRSRSETLLPARDSASPQRRDGLWARTCCELFVGRGAEDEGAGRFVWSAGGPYLEFNFAPGGDWAAYAFDAPRIGMRPFLCDAPQIASKTHFMPAEFMPAEPMPYGFELDVLIRTPIAAGRTRIVPTVVLETRQGVSHWAAHHPGERPDFHHPAGFGDPVEVAGAFA